VVTGGVTVSSTRATEEVVITSGVAVTRVAKEYVATTCGVVATGH
jgi:hypothetical protein